MRIILLSLLTINCFAQEITIWPVELDDTDSYFNTKFLSNYSAVSKKLIEEEDFKDVTFSSPDGIQLAGLARLPKDATFSVICCAGFLPGRKEGLATFARLFPKNANILFFDARGHGSSKGKFWTNLHNYGLNEYQDIAAAVDYIKKNSAYNTPIFLHGLCAGAYHAANTLMTIPKDDQIKGLIFDSGFTNPLTSMDIPGQYCKEKLAPRICASIYKENKEKAKTRLLSKILGAIAAGFFRALGACVYPFLKPKAAQLDLLTKIKTQPIEYPVLFIHAESDKFAKIENVAHFSELVTDSEKWWIPDAQNPKDPRPEHALNQIKCKHEYLKKLQAFINKQLNIPQNN
ncbi:MAG: hypothetical protein AMXMBFR12_08360 [Candidatus Babeliales bacterium]